MKPIITHRVTSNAESIAPLRSILVPLGGDPREGECRALNRWGIRGVPARLVDFWVAPALPSTGPIVVELGLKAGRYDGHERDRIQFTTRESCPHVPSAGMFGSQVSLAEVVVFAQAGKEAFVRAYPRKPLPKKGDYSLAGCCWWNYRRWYSWLRWEDVRGVCEAFAVTHGPQCEFVDPDGTVRIDINQANRLAGRELYRLARNLGWRKLPADMALALGLDPDMGPWYPESQCGALEARNGTYSGAGEHTIRTAYGYYHEDDFDEGE